MLPANRISRSSGGKWVRQAASLSRDWRRDGLVRTLQAGSLQYTGFLFHKHFVPLGLKRVAPTAYLWCAAAFLREFLLH